MDETMGRRLDVARRAATRISAPLVPVLVLFSLMGVADCGTSGARRAVSSRDGGSVANVRRSLNTAAPPAVATPLTGAHACRTSQLKITRGHSFAGLGTSGEDIRFINRSTSICELHGWPTLVAETAGAAHAHVVDRPGAEFADVRQDGVPRVILKPGQRAVAIFEAADESPSGATCGPAYRTLRVRPPQNTRSVTISAWIVYLGGFLPSCSTIRLSPVLPSTAVYEEGVASMVRPDHAPRDGRYIAAGEAHRSVR